MNNNEFEEEKQTLSLTAITKTTVVYKHSKSEELSLPEFDNDETLSLTPMNKSNTEFWYYINILIYILVFQWQLSNLQYTLLW